MHQLALLRTRCSTMCRALDIRTQDLEGFKNISRFGPAFTMGVLRAGDQARAGNIIDYQKMSVLFKDFMAENGKSLPMIRGSG
jgi:hypothetical protein